MTAPAPAALHVVEHGTGTPVLALHGWQPDHRLMLGCLEPVFAQRRGYRRVYPDLPGMGRSPAEPWMSGSQDLLDAVLALVDRTFGDEPFLLVGESYGGYLARALVALRPESVLGLALICPIGGSAHRPTVPLPERVVLREDPGLLGSVDPRLAEQFAGMAVVQSPETLRRFAEEIAPGLDCADASSLERIAARLWLDPEPSERRPFERPALVVTGRQDHATGYAAPYDLLPSYPRATFAVLDRAGHNAQIEQPALVEALLADWLDRVQAEG